MKRLCQLLAVALFAAALVGCGDNSPATSPGGSQDPGKNKGGAAPPPPPPPPLPDGSRPK